MKNKKLITFYFSVYSIPSSDTKETLKQKKQWNIVFHRFSSKKTSKKARNKKK